VRMSHTASGQTTNYTWDVASGLPVVLQDGTNTYVYGLDLISATDSGGAQTYFLHDGLGSTTGLTDGSGNVTATYTYDAFGKSLSEPGTSANYWRFTGEQRDSDSSLYYLRARYYDPATGRFLSQDPVPGGNLYAYVRNNPANLVDRNGALPGPPCLCIIPIEPIKCLLQGCSVAEVGGHHVTVEMILVCAYYRVNCAGGPRDLGRHASEVTLEDTGLRHPCDYTSDCEGTFDHENPSDAFEHCFWSGLLTIHHGAGFAEAYLNAYEAWPGNPRGQREYDLWNNRRGRDFAKNLSDGIHGETLLRRHCKE